MDAPTSALPQKAAASIAAPTPQVGTPVHIDGSPLNISFLHKPSARSSLLPATAAPGAPPSRPKKPVSTVPIDIDPQSQKHADTLAQLGIKVRDFAYESTLPPIPPYIRFRQVLPGPTPLKRHNDDPEAGPSSSKRSKLTREDTEPDIPQPTIGRARGFTNLRDYEPEPSRSRPLSQQSNPITSQLPLRYLYSREPEPYIDTPVVTPNGSLHWKHDAPASQPDPEALSSLLGSSQSVDTTGTGLFGPLTPMSSLSSITSDPPVSPKLPLTDSKPKATLPLPVPVPAASRYQLRRRAAQPQAPVTVTTTRRTTYSAAHPLSRPPVAHSRQASHSRTKSKAVSSPHARTLRKRPVKPDDAMLMS
ncbi:hypothetical protein H0H81_011590 [Sphagnurus paluster]|uniref:Uncharacterized protein n=1 Tax=Sphagnurus paluster TaxID=117069 RepID=A0A9P7KN91_9AGAR|nr:hypothetical protein H0H81_011590 [Sphagnurus paluster]